MKHWKRGTPWNPLVKDSRAQMHALFEAKQILLSPKCSEPSDGFPSLVESFRRAKIGPRGGLLEKGQFQHGPDGVRYLAWKFLPRANRRSRSTNLITRPTMRFGGSRSTGEGATDSRRRQQ
jgi:hypothetical protein